MIGATFFGSLFLPTNKIKKRGGAESEL